MPIAIHNQISSPTTTSNRHAEYHEHLDETLALQRDVEDDVDGLIAQEGFDVGVQRGLREWAGDTGSVWRALRVCFPLFAPPASILKGT
jgi:hypothetical protein